jgi:mRNA interferase HigB
MHVISYKHIREFIKENPDSNIKLGRWYKWMKKGKYKSLAELRRKFPDMDYIGNDRFVFNISGNKYRLVVLINFCKQKAFIRFIGTHSEYEKINCKTI